MRLPLFAALTCAAMSTSAFAQVAVEPLAIAPQEQQALVPQTLAPAESVAQPTELHLPANANVVLALNSGLNSKTHRLGDRFSMTVAQDIFADGQIVIPRGTRAVGQVTKVRGNGS